MYGLCQSEQEMQGGLDKFKTIMEKFKVLKAQLEFWRKVLEQTNFDKEIFFLSKNGKQLSVQEVSKNLCQLFSTSEPSSTACESLAGRRIRHHWCNSDGTEQWYLGRVLSLISGTDDWLNVEYDNESQVLSLNLMQLSYVKGCKLLGMVPL